MSWLRKALDAKHMLIRASAVRLNTVVPNYAFACVALLALLPLIVLPHTVDGDNAAASSPVSPFVQLVQRGQYTPHHCSQYNSVMASAMSRYLPEMGRIARRANMTLVTGNHVRIPFCVLYLEQNGLPQFMLNPRFVPAAQQQRYDITSRSLCNSSSTSVPAMFFSAGELFWTSPGNNPRKQTLDGLLALEVQTALFIMQGGDICGKASA